MKIVYEYSHLGGREILQVRQPDILKEIDDVVKQIAATKSKISKEKTMVGKQLYSPKDMNQQFRVAFESKGYAEVRDTYDITLPNSNLRIKGAFKQIDYVKNRVLVEVQFRQIRLHVLRYGEVSVLLQ